VASLYLQTQRESEQAYPAPILSYFNSIYGENGGGLLRLNAPGLTPLTSLGAGDPAGGGVCRSVAGWQPARPKIAANAANA
jgi:hypothetical protein